MVQVKEFAVEQACTYVLPPLTTPHKFKCFFANVMEVDG